MPPAATPSTQRWPTSRTTTWQPSMHASICWPPTSLAALDFVRIVGPADGARHVGAVAFNVEGVHPHDVASILDMGNVCIRAGHHCAQPLLAYLGESSTCRASIAFYNDKQDIDALVEGLKTVWQVFNGN